MTGTVPPCNCRCGGCCLRPFGGDGAPIDPAAVPQRFQIDTDPWSWAVAEGLTQVDQTSADLTTATETNIASQEFHSLTIAHNLDSLGQSQIAWSFWYEKYGPAFGTAPPITPYGYFGGAWAFPYKWLVADDRSVIQFFHPAYGIVRNGFTYEKVSVAAACESYLRDMIDTSANASGATPWRAYDPTELAAIDATYPTDFAASDLRIGASGYLTPLNPNIAWDSLAVTYGNTIEISIHNQSPGPCHWQAVVRIRPRFSIWSNGLLTRPEYYRLASTPVPPDLHANGYIRQTVSPGQQSRYTGRFGFVQPAALQPGAGEYGDWKFGRRGFGIPPEVINRYGMADPFHDDTTRYQNGAAIDNAALVSDDPPGGWRSWIEITYRSVNPINCTDDIENSEPIALALVTDPVRLYSGPVSYMPWADWLDLMADAWGLGSPPTTMTIQRLADL